MVRPHIAAAGGYDGVSESYFGNAHGMEASDATGCDAHSSLRRSTVRQMSTERWTEVDRYIDDHLVREDDVLRKAIVAAARAGLPAISVTPAQGKLLHLLARGIGARMILELGT